jgi:hypothetical protein
MKASFSLSYVLLLAGALSMGCAMQAGTDESSQAEGLTADQGVQVQQQEAPSAKQRVQLAPQAVGRPVMHTTDLPKTELEGLAGTDPGGNVQDDGDGKEPDPHPWHTNTATLAGH